MAGGIDWFRWHHGSANDPKFRLVAKHAGARVGDVVAMWAMLLEQASANHDRGDPGNIDFETIDLALDMAEGTARAIHEAMKSRNLIDQETGRVVAWERRQPKRERDPAPLPPEAPAPKTSTERSRECRARNKAANAPCYVTQRHATPSSASNGNATPREEKSREEEKNTPPPPAVTGDEGVGSGAPTKAGLICRAIRAKGISDAHPGQADFVALVSKGVPVDTFEAAAETCLKAKPPKGFVYLLGIVKRQLAEANAIDAAPGMPEKPWDTDRPSIEAMGMKLGLGKWNENDLSVNRERFDQYTARVRRAVEEDRQRAAA